MKINGEKVTDEIITTIHWRLSWKLLK